MGMSVYAVVRSSKQKQNDNIEKLFQQHSDSLTKLGETLQSHAEDDIAIQTELQTELRNNVKLAEKLDSKLDKVLERI
jgi:transcription initiation factor IIF auxiliary subunit